MSVKINGLVFDRANYDADGDVLYLARGESTEAADAALTPEGHGVRYDADGQVMGVTIIGARRLLDRDGHLTITLPHEVRVEARATSLERWRSPERGQPAEDLSLQRRGSVWIRAVQRRGGHRAASSGLSARSSCSRSPRSAVRRASGSRPLSDAQR